MWIRQTRDANLCSCTTKDTLFERNLLIHRQGYVQYIYSLPHKIEAPPSYFARQNIRFLKLADCYCFTERKLQNNTEHSIVVSSKLLSLSSDNIPVTQ